LSAEPALLAAEKSAPAPRPTLRSRLVRDGGIIFGAIILLLMAVIGLAAPLLGTKSPSEINPSFRNRVPGIEQTIRNDDGTTRTFTYGWAPTASAATSTAASSTARAFR
jgi:peptide/nickel transport system permease protein